MEQAHFTQNDRDTLIEVKTTLNRAVQDIANLSNNFASKEEVVELKKEIALTKASLEKNFAAKWVEKAVWAACATVGAALIIAGISKILNK